MKVPEGNGSKKLFADLVLALSLIAAALVALVFAHTFIPKGDQVSVKIDGKLYGRYALSEDCEISIRSESGVNVLVIEDGKAYISDADCPDGICAAHAPISKKGETIVCLPHRLVVCIESGNKEESQ